MNPALIAGIVEGFGALAGMAAKLISAPDPAAVLADMRAELEKMHGKIGPGGTLDQTIAANNAALDAAIAAEKAKQEETTDPGKLSVMTSLIVEPSK